MRSHLRALHVLLLVPCVAIAATSPQPSLDKILANHIAADGGMARIKAIRSLRSTGHISIGPTVLDLTIENPRGAFRSDTSIQGITKTEAFDGVHGWVVDPFTQGPTAVAEPMTADQLKQVALQMDFDGPLVDYRHKGHKVVLMGRHQVNGSDAYALKITLKNGDELTSFIDAKTWLEIGASNKAVSQGKVVDIDTTLGDYRAVNGVMLPFSIVIKPKGQPQGMTITMDKVEANTPMDPARFRMPAPKPGADHAKAVSVALPAENKQGNSR